MCQWVSGGEAGGWSVDRGKTRDEFTRGSYQAAAAPIRTPDDIQVSKLVPWN